MPKWTEYTSKDTLADNDEVMLYDATARANKRGLMSKFWDYVVDKMATAVISKLETNNKTIIGAINALNSDSIRVGNLPNAMIKEIESSFQNVDNYSLFSGSTQSELECGYYGYKHSNSIPSSAIIFSREHTYIGIRDPGQKSWNLYLIK